MSVADEIRENRTRFDAEIARLRADVDTTPEAKARRMKELHAKAMERHQALIAGERQAAQAESEEIYRMAFGPGYRSPNPDEPTKLMTMLSYRDAIGRAAAVESPEALIDLRRRAQVTGDTLLAKACVLVAFERGNRRILADAAESDANLQKVLEGNFGDGIRDAITDNLSASMSAPQLPPEARGMVAALGSAPPAGTRGTDRVNAAIRSA